MAKTQPDDKATSPAADPAQRYTLKKGRIEFRAPGYMGGARITLVAGEPVAPAIWAHVPAKDRALFEPYTPPAPKGA